MDGSDDDAVMFKIKLLTETQANREDHERKRAKKFRPAGFHHEELSDER